jgi:hypothetical protein
MRGQPGVVYILGNEGLRHDWVKIGCSTRSGDARATDLNSDANTGTPGVFHCVFQQSTLDCGTAERRVFAELRSQRRGKPGQEFFQVELQHAKETITRVCEAVDALETARKAAEQAPDPPVYTTAPTPAPEIPRISKPTLATSPQDKKSKWGWWVAGAIAILIWWNAANTPAPRYSNSTSYPVARPTPPQNYPSRQAPAPVVTSPEMLTERQPEVRAPAVIPAPAPRDGLPDNANDGPRHVFSTDGVDLTPVREATLEERGELVPALSRPRPMSEVDQTCYSDCMVTGVVDELCRRDCPN